MGSAGLSSAFNPLKGVMPGAVAKPHAELEENCTDCHQLGSKNYKKKCIACHDHKVIEEDLRLKRGFHGKIGNTKCESCHSEHKGRNFALIVLDKKKFDHDLTELPLLGKHQPVACEKCHEKNDYRAAETACFSCHKKDDTHEGALGKKCGECHVADDWKKIAFNHDKTEFPLLGKHIGPACKACHLKTRLKDTPKACVACHKKEDKHKAVLGKKCATCHNAEDWKKTNFDHNKARFRLIDKHKKVACLKCHRDQKLRSTPKTCIACHKKDDVHKRKLNDKCQTCHTIKTWKKAALFNHQKTTFPLLGKHKPTACAKCHKTQVFVDTPDVCSVCHKKDDVHKGVQGDRCEQCHGEDNWKKTVFNHDKTKFPLLFKHRPVKCAACHKNKDLKQTPKTCVACHKKDDVHKTILGRRCASCHTEKDWKASSFDHDTTKFKLIDKHEKTKCLACHRDARLKQTPKACAACHKKDDVHKNRLGPKCQNCHDIKTWLKAPRFNHQKSRFPLLGKHKPTPCADCHKTKIFTDTPDVCSVCHKKNDVHKGILGQKCETCHAEADWKKARFNHNETSFPLFDKHAKVKCIKCHKKPELKQTPKRCVTCHKKEDVHKGKLGDACQSCHTIKTWLKARLFNHQKTNFPLMGKHKPTVCKKCHETKTFTGASTVCSVCHKKDDVHKGRFGPKCEGCHTEKTFERKDFNHKKETGYLLKLKHLKIPCLECHIRPFYERRTSRVCVVCHRQDDVHEGELGTRCEVCHSEAGFPFIKAR